MHLSSIVNMRCGCVDVAAGSQTLDCQLLGGHEEAVQPILSHADLSVVHVVEHSSELSLQSKAGLSVDFEQNARHVWVSPWFVQC